MEGELGVGRLTTLAPDRVKEEASWRESRELLCSMQSEQRSPVAARAWQRVARWAATTDQGEAGEVRQGTQNPGDAR